LRELSEFEVLTFDCYGTLIDWETGMLEALRPWLERCAVRPDDDQILEAFARHEVATQTETPGLLYPAVLAEVHRRLALEWGIESRPADAESFGQSVPRWPAFPDSAAALRTLQEHYRLVVLSNIDRASFRASAEHLGVEFDAVFTAEEIGSYKPDLRNFEHLLRELGKRGIAADKILHTAQSLYHDHQPARSLGLATAWIDRRHDRGGSGATPPTAGTVEFDFRFTSLGEMAAARVAEASAR
jgi:2-haloalkanoic acid dehalogenase type II